MITRIAETGDIPQIVDLLVTVFPHHARSSRHWEWSHLGGRGLAVVAEDDGRIVGHYSFGYQPFEWRGRTYVGGFGQQAAVHPAHRDLQTIVELIGFAEKAAKCDFVFAFPNENMAPIKERVLGWSQVLSFHTLTMPLEAFNPKADHSSVHRLTTFSGLDIPTCRDPEMLTPIIDAEWLEWRYIMHPLNHYACFASADGKAVMVLKAYFGAEDRRGHILELHGSTDESKINLLSAAADYFQFMGASSIHVWGQCKPNQALYEDLGFQPSSATSTLYAKALTEGSQDVISADWSFDMGVSDVF